MPIGGFCGRPIGLGDLAGRLRNGKEEQRDHGQGGSGNIHEKHLAGGHEAEQQSAQGRRKDADDALQGLVHAGDASQVLIGHHQRGG